MVRALGYNRTNLGFRVLFAFQLGFRVQPTPKYDLYDQESADPARIPDPRP